MGGESRASVGFLESLSRALGFRRYLIWGLSTTAATLYGRLRDWLLELGVTFLPDWNPLLLTGIVFFGFLFYYLVSRLRELESHLEPQLEIVGPTPYTRPKEAPGKCVRTFKIRVRNRSGTLIPNAHVTLETMANKHGQLSKEHGQCFKQTLDNVDLARTSYKKTFDLHPHRWIEVDLVRYDETKNDTHVQMMYAVNPSIDRNVFERVPLNVCPHTVTVCVCGSNTTPIYNSFVFFVNEDGYLTVEGAESAVPN